MSDADVSRATAPSPNAVPASAADKVYRKIMWRMLPVLFLGYVFANIDRVNIGMAQLAMKQDLGFSDAVYGFGAGIMFVSYALFEVPSNLLLEKIGARKTLMRIMICWGLVSAAVAFVTTPMGFYILRFMLGVFEAGFYPGLIYFFTRWFPESRRARPLGILSCGLSVANVVANPLSGYIMKTFDGVAGYHGWQWLFPLEGLPCVLIGVAVYFLISETPKDARWLSEREKQILAFEMASSKGPETHHISDFVALLKQAKVYQFAAIYFCFICGIAVMPFWLPDIIKSMGYKDVFQIGMMAAIPATFAVALTVLLSISSDRLRERRWHIALTAITGGLAMMLTPTVKEMGMIPAFVVLSLASACTAGLVPVFWSLVTTVLKGGGAAGGIALVSSIGLLGASFSSMLTGYIKSVTGSTAGGLYANASIFLLGVVLLLVFTRRGAGDRPAGRGE